MRSQISGSAPATGRIVNHATVFGLSRRYVAPAQFKVALSPLLPAHDVLGSPIGWLARPDASFKAVDSPDAIKRELAILTWTTMAADALHPDDFIAVTVTPEMALAPAFGRTVRELACDRLMLVFETARVGRRRQTLGAAVSEARRYGIKVGVSGNRVTSTEEFDAVLVTPSTSALVPPAGGSAVIIATELRTEEDLAWARSYHAALLEGPVLVGPMTVAPVDLRRLSRR